jgi:hypothetical protein
MTLPAGAHRDDFYTISLYLSEVRMPKKSTVLKTVGGLAAAIASAVAAYTFVARPWHLRWGAAKNEVQRSLPGDELVPVPQLNATHAVTIRATAAQVWPWLAQIGQGRGGFYSYDWIENLMGLDIHNTSRILPEHQELKVGDTIPLAPDGFGVPVAICEPGKTLVLHGDTRKDPGAIPTMNPGDFMTVSWGFYLFEQGGQTRLVERWRADWNPSAQNWLFMHVFMEPGAFLMERKMLLGIKQRAEANISLPL